MSTLAEKLSRTKNAVDSIRTTVEKTNNEPIEEVVSAVEDLKNNSGGGGGIPVELEEKDINFYDYDATLLYAYTLEEFNSMNELPPAPTYNGKTSSWNWTLENIKSEGKPTDVGADYGGSICILIDIPENKMVGPYLTAIYTTTSSYLTETTATVNWGDDSEPSKYTVRKNNTTTIGPRHKYNKAGEYWITISLGSATGTIKGNSTTSKFFPSSAYLSASKDDIEFLKYIKYLKISSNVILDEYALNSLYNLKMIVLNGCSFKGYYQINNCLNLEKIILSKSINSIPANSLKNNYNLKSITFPNSITDIPTLLLQNNYTCKKISLPREMSVTNNSFFNSNYMLESLYFDLVGDNNIIGGSDLRLLKNVKVKGSLKTVNPFSTYAYAYYDFTECTNIPALSSSTAFGSGLPGYRVLVPSDLYDDWISATNWSSIVSYIYIIDENGNYVKP